MHPALDPKSSIQARWISSPAFANGKLYVALPEIVDSMNARLLRKLVLGRLAEAKQLRFDARNLNKLGRVGAATLWQIMGIAERHGVYVEMVRVKPELYLRLNNHKDAEARRQTHYLTQQNLIHIFVDEGSEGGSEGKTIRLRRSFQSGRLRSASVRRKSSESWTGKVIKLLTSGRRRKAA